jgi:hypothetical protein
MAKSIQGPSLTFIRSTYKDLINATSSQASAAGLMRSALQDGRIADLFGLEVAPASLSPSRDKAEEWTIQGIYGLTSFGSSAPSGPLSYWENRLRERLATVGSMEFALIWKEKTTPAGESIFQLSRSMRHTSGNGSTGSPATWPTPRSSDEKNGNGKTGNRTPEAAHKAGWTLSELTRATWPTPTKADGDGGHGMGQASATGKRPNGTKITVSLPGVVKIVGIWPTPMVSDVKHVSETPETWAARNAAEKAKNPKLGGLHKQLGVTAKETAASSGQMLSGSPVQTGNYGGLNPAFPCWLMGFPDEWESCAPTVTPSSRKSRRK